MPEPFLEACLRDQREEAQRLLSLRVFDDWFEQRHLMDLRLRQCREDMRYRDWCVRAIALRGQDEMIGYIGFHTLPGPPHLAELAPQGVELGYTIAETHRRLGYASEALKGMMRWAHQTHGAACFVLSISPANLPSQGLAKKLHFEKMGHHIDDEDGLEELWLLTGDRLAQELAQLG